jgi:hypothetical protein
MKMLQRSGHVEFKMQDAGEIALLPLTLREGTSALAIMSQSQINQHTL